jgi:protein O-mannosyl-transferase
VILPEQTSLLRNEWLWGLFLALAVILTYLSVWRAGFIWDDDFCVTKNPCIVGPLSLKEIWTTKAADICPLTFTTFWVEHALWGLNPQPYHLVNVLLQAGAAILLWRVLRLLGAPGAWLGAALWALHPVTVESVAWITEMKNTQSGLFFSNQRRVVERAQRGLSVYRVAESLNGLV